MNCVLTHTLTIFLLGFVTSSYFKGLLGILYHPLVSSRYCNNFLPVCHFATISIANKFLNLYLIKSIILYTEKRTFWISFSKVFYILITKHSVCIIGAYIKGTYLTTENYFVELSLFNTISSAFGRIKNYLPASLKYCDTYFSLQCFPFSIIFVGVLKLHFLTFIFMSDFKV